MSMGMVFGVLSCLAAAMAGLFLADAHAERRRRQDIKRRFEQDSGTDSVIRDEDGGRFGVLERLPVVAKSSEQRSVLEARARIPEMIDSVALGMRAGLSFDRAFELYCSRFQDPFALACKGALSSWQTGLVSREDALRSLAERYEIGVLDRFVSNVNRALRFGSPMTQILESLAAEARSEYRSQMEETVSKAPVKMLVPTAALILPAMLILVMGPVLLEFL